MKYSATFSNGQTINRTSKRDYTHAYMVWAEYNGKQYIATVGFASSQDLAIKASKPTAKYIIKREIVEVNKF